MGETTQQSISTEWATYKWSLTQVTNKFLFRKREYRDSHVCLASYNYNHCHAHLHWALDRILIAVEPLERYFKPRSGVSKSVATMREIYI